MLTSSCPLAQRARLHLPQIVREAVVDEEVEAESQTGWHGLTIAANWIGPLMKITVQHGSVHHAVSNSADQKVWMRR